MRWGLFGVRLSIIAVNIIIAALLVLSLIPLATGGLNVTLPQSTLPQPTLQNGTVGIVVPVDIHNGGFFDITDFSSEVQIYDQGSLVAEHRSNSTVNIPAGTTTRLQIDMTIPLSTQTPSEVRRLVLNGTVLQVNMTLGAFYTLGLVGAKVTTTQDVVWQPLINNLNIDQNAVRALLNGTTLNVVVPYSFQATDALQGMTQQIHATLNNNIGVISKADQNITIGPTNSGELRFVIAAQDAMGMMSHAEDLTIGVDLTTQGTILHLDFPYHWGGMT